MEPYVRRVKQIIMNWQTLCTDKWIPSSGVEEYWDKMRLTTIKIIGPIHIVARILQDLKIKSRGPRVWKQGNEFLDLTEINDIKLKAMLGKKR